MPATLLDHLVLPGAADAGADHVPSRPRARDAGEHGGTRPERPRPGGRAWLGRSSRPMAPSRLVPARQCGKVGYPGATGSGAVHPAGGVHPPGPRSARSASGGSRRRPRPSRRTRRAPPPPSRLRSPAPHRRVPTPGWPRLTVVTTEMAPPSRKVVPTSTCPVGRRAPARRSARRRGGDPWPR
jgi:hypothetical protein